MPLPNDPISWARGLDPAEILDYIMDLRGIMEAGEVIETYTVTMYPEGAALGVSILSGDGRDPSIVTGDAANDPIPNGQGIKLWFGVDSEMQADPAFEGNGTRIGVEVNAVTNALPFRRIERTFVLTIRQR